VTGPNDPLDPDLDAELDARAEPILEVHDLAGRLYDILEFELLTPARERGNDRALPFVVNTLRATANMLERVVPLDRP
jgi:hypothetical protein